jgi:hypothetical protein
MRLVTEIFRHINAYLMVLSYSIDDISKIFNILSNFLKNAPDDFFEDPKQYYRKKKSFKEIPLFLTDKGSAVLKKDLSEYPKILQSGTIQQEGQGEYKEAHPSFLYLVGQFLSTVATKLDYLELSNKIFYENNKNGIEKLFQIWGKKDQMNSNYLFTHFESKNNEIARKEIEKKLSDSATLLNNFKV